MFATYCFWALLHNHGVSKYLALVITIAGAAVVGALISIGIFRPLRTAPVLARWPPPWGCSSPFRGSRR